MKLRIVYNAPVVLTFALLSGAVLLMSMCMGGSFLYTFFVLRRGSLLDPLFWFRLVFYVFGHADLQHYLSNMMLFLVIGPSVEEKYGSKNTFFMIVVTAIATAIVHIGLTSDGLIGSSGVVFGFIVLASMTSFKKGEIPLTMIGVILMYLGQEVADGLFKEDQVSQLAHICGGLIGASCGFVYKYKINPE
ncbi:MAG: rhomboid family intramembrane serine protease [Erysipelotrichaceae bacterium]|nr:rhomboid family intramembrane serine protease [Erysipelotrichaceae bacterium]